MSIRNSVLVIIVLMGLGCNTNKNETNSGHADIKTPSVEKEKISSQQWMDAAITTYIRTTGNELIKAGRKSDLSETWITDSEIQTDTANYLLINIGHHVTDEGNKNPRFATDAWLYIDTMKRKLYEYDLPGDRLIPLMQ